MFWVKVECTLFAWFFVAVAGYRVIRNRICKPGESQSGGVESTNMENYRAVGRAQVVAVPVLIVLFGAIARAANDSATPQAGPSEDPAPAPTAAGQSGNQPVSVNPLTGLISVSSANYRPLSPKERWVLYWKQNYLSAGAYAGPYSRLCCWTRRPAPRLSGAVVSKVTDVVWRRGWERPLSRKRSRRPSRLFCTRMCAISRAPSRDSSTAHFTPSFSAF